MNVHGDNHDQAYGHFNHDQDEYLKFIRTLRKKATEFHNLSEQIVYTPRYTRTHESIINAGYIECKDYRRRHEELLRRLPLLEGLKEVPMTVVPRGNNTARYLNEVKTRLNGEKKVSIAGEYYSDDVQELISKISSLKEGLDVVIVEDAFVRFTIDDISRPKLVMCGIDMRV